jgi:uncharacterized membrane protein
MAHYLLYRYRFLISVIVVLIAVVLLLIAEGSFGTAVIVALGVLWLMRLAVAPRRSIDA